MDDHSRGCLAAFVGEDNAVNRSTPGRTTYDRDSNDTVRKKGMTRATLADRKATSPGRAQSVAPRRLGPWDVLILAAWCGLAAGLLEVGARILCRWINPTNRLYQVSRHFVWLAPLTYFLLFLAIGLLLAAVTRLWPGEEVGSADASSSLPPSCPPSWWPVPRSILKHG